MTKISVPQDPNSNDSNIADIQIRAYPRTDTVVREPASRHPSKLDSPENMSTTLQPFLDDNSTLDDLKWDTETRYGFHATAPIRTIIFKTELPKTNCRSRAATPQKRGAQFDTDLQKGQNFRVVYYSRYHFQVGYPSDSLAFRGHDVFQVYEAIFIATRDYTDSRLQDTSEAPEHIASAYSALCLICRLLSAAQRRKESIPAFRKKHAKHARTLSEITHLLPRMFTQVVLLANGSHKLPKSSIASLQWADGMARRIPCWPPRHPVRRILSNFVALGHSEDSKIVSQVAKNARRCVFDTCSNKGLHSTASSDLPRLPRLAKETERNRKVLRPASEQSVGAQAGKGNRLGDSLGKPNLQQSWLFDSEKAKISAPGKAKDNLQGNGSSQHIIPQPTKGVDKKPSDHESRNYRPKTDENCLPNISANNIESAATISALKADGAASLMNSGITTFPTQQPEDCAIDILDDGPYGSLAGNGTIMVTETDHRMGIFDQYRLFIERIFGEELDWRPLPPIKHPLGPGQSRMTWTYNGSPMSILLNEDETLRYSTGPSNYYGNSSILPVRQPVPHTEASESKTSGSGQHSRTSAWRQILSWSSARPDQGKVVPVSSGPGDKIATQQMESHLCVDKCWSSTHDTRMTTLESVQHMKSDYEYFRQARDILNQKEGGWLQRKVSWRSYTRVTLSRFHFLFDNSDKVEAIEFNSLPCPQDICSGYEFKCPRRAEIDIQMRIYAKIILEGIRSPELGRGSRTLLDGIPKLKAPPGLAKRAMNSGWGFHARHGLSVVKMLGWTVAILVVGLGFVPFWLASIDRLDLQSALAPASILVAVFTLLVAILALDSGFNQ